MASRLHAMDAKMSLGYEKSKAMLETGLLSDCQFEIEVSGAEPEILKAHKNQLVYASDVFKDLFLDPELGNGPIKVAGVTPQIFKKLLLYIYTYELELKNGQESVELALAADKYNITDLKAKCIEFIKLNFDRREIWDIILLIEPLHDSSLQEICKVLIMEHAEECLSYESFMNIPRKNVLEILQYETMNITSEMVLIKACVNWANYNIGDGKTLRDEMVPFLPHLRLLSLKSKDFAEGPAQQDWLTSEEKNFIFSYMASSSAVSMSEAPCSLLIETRKKPNCHIYSGVFCVATSCKMNVAIPQSDLKYNLSGFQFCLQEKVMPNIYVHDIKVYVMMNGECFKKIVRSSTFKDGQNYLVTLQLAECILLDCKLDYKFIIKVWRQDGKESVYLQPDVENVDMSAGKMGFFLLIKCGNLFENTISKIDSIVINIESKKEPAISRSIKDALLEEVEIDDQNDNDGDSPNYPIEEKDEDDNISMESDMSSDEEEPEEECLAVKFQEALLGNSDSDNEADCNDGNSSPLVKILFSQVDEMREIKDPMLKKPHLPHVDESAQKGPGSGANHEQVLKRSNHQDDKIGKRKKARKQDITSKAH